MIKYLIDKQSVRENPNKDDDAGVDFVDPPVPNSCLGRRNFTTTYLSNNQYLLKSLNMARYVDGNLYLFKRPFCGIVDEESEVGNIVKKEEGGKEQLEAPGCVFNNNNNRESLGSSNQKLKKERQVSWTKLLFLGVAKIHP